MSKFEIKMPKLGESITEGTIVSLNIKTGDLVDEDQILFEVTTAKVNAEVPSPVAGKVVEILFNEGDTVEVGKTVLLIDLEGASAEVAGSAAENQSPDTPAESNQPENNSASASPAPKPEKPSNESERWYSPAVLQLAKQEAISVDELEKIQGTGYLGRLSKKDLKNYIETGATRSTQTIQDKKLRPVEKPIETPLKSTPAYSVSMETSSGEVKDMDAVGKIIADRMILSKQTSAHVTTVVEVDVTKLVNWRKKLPELPAKGVCIFTMPPPPL